MKNKKNTLIGATYGICLCVLLYAAFAFTIWDINPSNWSIDARYWMASLSFVAVCASVGICSLND